MKVAILAGGKGTRLYEETVSKPKAMVQIGNKPILWHIIKYYSYYGFKEFIIALGYKGNVIKRWMYDYYSLKRDMTIETSTCKVTYTDKQIDNETDWIIHLVDTGQETSTGGRIKRLAPWLSEGTFMLTWCDGLADVDLQALLRFHISHKRLATLTAVRPPSRFGHLIMKGDQVVEFREKPKTTNIWINGAFFVLEPEIMDYIKDDNTMWEKEPLEQLAKDGQLMAFRHEGFWQCMDTIPEKMKLEKLWQSGNAPWKKYVL